MSDRPKIVVPDDFPPVLSGGAAERELRELGDVAVFTERGADQEEELIRRIGNAQWDDTAVRKVLRTFAYGGQAGEVQIHRWANMTPRAAIVEMLTFDTTNDKLSPPAVGDTDDLASIVDPQGGTVRSPESELDHLAVAIEKGLRAEGADDLASIVDVAGVAVRRSWEQIGHMPAAVQEGVIDRVSAQVGIADDLATIVERRRAAI